MEKWKDIVIIMDTNEMHIGLLPLIRGRLPWCVGRWQIMMLTVVVVMVVRWCEPSVGPMVGRTVGRNIIYDAS